jgi:hypothetical protein
MRLAAFRAAVRPVCVVGLELHVPRLLHGSALHVASVDVWPRLKQRPSVGVYIDDQLKATSVWRAVLAAIDAVASICDGRLERCVFSDIVLVPWAPADERADEPVDDHEATVAEDASVIQAWGRTVTVDAVLVPVLFVSVPAQAQTQQPLARDAAELLRLRCVGWLLGGV